jgi:hypothetical protein
VLAVISLELFMLMPKAIAERTARLDIRQALQKGRVNFNHLEQKVGSTHLLI